MGSWGSSTYLLSPPDPPGRFSRLRLEDAIMDNLIERKVEIQWKA